MLKKRLRNILVVETLRNCFGLVKVCFKNNFKISTSLTNLLYFRGRKSSSIRKESNRHEGRQVVHAQLYCRLSGIR